MPTPISKDHYAVRRSSAGLGLFAVAPIKKGSWIIEYVGKRYPNKEVEENTTKYLFEVNGKETIDGSPRYNTARYINHSCRPNAEAEIVKARVYIRAIKDIPAGDEVCYDYGKEYFDEFIKPHGCRCAKCAAKRGK